LVGASNASSENILFVAATSLSSIILTNTTEIYSTNNYDNGAYWYRKDGTSFGFAESSSL
jgi:hypothetical protein